MAKENTKIEEFNNASLEERVGTIEEKLKTITQRGENAIVEEGRLQSPIYIPNLKGYALRNDNIAELNDVKIKIFIQNDEPTAIQLPEGQIALWEDTNDSNKLYFCANRSGTIKTILLT
jgi:hypothetical protein